MENQLFCVILINILYLSVVCNYFCPQRAKVIQVIIFSFTYANLQMPPMPNVVEDYTEKIWAHLMIKELLQQIQLETSPKLIESLRKEALQLSLQYHLVTPLSALLFYTPPDEDPRFPHALAARLRKLRKCVR